MSADRVEREAWDEFDTAQMDAAFPVCFFCGRPVNEDTAFRRVHGWVRARGLANFRRDGYGEDWACKVCLDIDKTVGPEQGGLF